MADNEFEIIQTYFQSLTTSGHGVVTGIGDDAAILDVPPGQELVVSMDTLVSGIHFKPETDPVDLGYKSLAVNLSDMAAMGATPMWATLSLTLPGSDSTWLKGFSTGFARLANQYQVSLVGGDMSRGPLSISVHISGVCPRGKSLMRTGARADDDIYVTGYPGTAGRALRGLLSEPESANIPVYCMNRLHRPEPRVEHGIALRDLAHCAIDISDGLVADLGHILKASGVGAEIILSEFPLHDELLDLKDRHDFWDMVLCTGDDYELCFTAAEESRPHIQDLEKIHRIPVTRIGRITSTAGSKWCLPDGTVYQPAGRGYRHF